MLSLRQLKIYKIEQKMSPKVILVLSGTDPSLNQEIELYQCNSNGNILVTINECSEIFTLRSTDGIFQLVLQIEFGVEVS